MDYFDYRDGKLHCEEIPVDSLAEEYDTPLFVYSQRTFREHYEKIRSAFSGVDHLICYAVKANSNLSVLQELASWGSGFDVVSGGELTRVLRAGGSADKVMFAGVGKTDAEISDALQAGIFLFNVESSEELETINRIASVLGKTAPVTLRLNPDVDPQTHRYISTGKKASKFGIDLERARALVASISQFEGVRLTGLHCHIGSQITDTAPYKQAVEKVVTMLGEARDLGHEIEWINMGGGFGIHYKGEEALPAEAFAEVIVPAIEPTGCRLALEPGRFIVGNAGILVSRVIYNKQGPTKRFVICDAGMNDLIRPSLYSAYHRAWPVNTTIPEGSEDPSLISSDLVGPICETGDFLAKDRMLPAVESGDLMAVFSTGAYGFVMASNYNTRPRAAEVMVEGDTHRLIRKRETVDELLDPESILMRDV